MLPAHAVYIEQMIPALTVYIEQMKPALTVHRTNDTSPYSI